MKRFVLYFAVLLLWGIGTPTFAQISLSGVGGDQSELLFEPVFPEPNSSFTVTLDAYSHDTVGSTIRWFLDGTEVANTKNQREIELTASSLGTSMQIIAQITLRSGRVVAVERTISPSAVDIILEADTFTPSGYRGAALPSRGAAVTATAIPHLGQNRDAALLTYTWKLNNNVLFGGNIKGKQQATFEMPSRPRSTLIVEVSDDSGRMIARNAIRMTGNSPEVQFYEDNPLRGVSTYAIGAELDLLGDEARIQAVPYFTNLESSTIFQRWFLDGIEVGSSDTIALEATEIGGVTRIRYELQDTENLLQSAQQQLLIKVRNLNF